MTLNGIISNPNTVKSYQFYINLCAQQFMCRVTIHITAHELRHHISEIIKWNYKWFLLFISHKSTWHRGRTWAATVTLCFICRASAMSESRVAKHRRSRKWKLSIGIQDVTKLFFILLEWEQCLYKNCNSKLPFLDTKLTTSICPSAYFPLLDPKGPILEISILFGLIQVLSYPIFPLT